MHPRYRTQQLSSFSIRALTVNFCQLRIKLMFCHSMFVCIVLPDHKLLFVPPVLFLKLFDFAFKIHNPSGCNVQTSWTRIFGATAFKRPFLCLIGSHYCLMCIKGLSRRQLSDQWFCRLTDC